MARRANILIVDDNEMNRDLLENALDFENYTLHTANDGEQGLSMAFDLLPDIILLDINMPKLSGYEVCKLLKEDTRTVDIPVIFISALNETDNIVHGFDLGGVDYITKPFKFREVIARVGMHIQMYHQKKELEEMHAREAQRHEMIDQMRQQFIGSATHDLKNPLQIIAGYISVLETEPDVNENEFISDSLIAMKRGVVKMDHLIHDMLDLLQLEQGSPLLIEKKNFTAFVENSVRDMGIRAEEKDITFTVDVEQSDAIIELDEYKMGRVLDNLASNAIKYTQEGGEVRMIGRVFDDAFVIEVADNGLGIPEDMIADLFTPFARVRLKTHMQEEGTGLGLSIVKSIVDQHDAHIEVESTLGKGSIFRVIFPR